MQSITLPSPSPSPSPTPVRFPRTPPAAPPTPTRVRPSASPPGSPTPTPLQTPPSPLPSATPTPVVFGPTPLATPTPPDAPTPTAAGVRIFGIVQTHCRNGNVDAGRSATTARGISNASGESRHSRLSASLPAPSANLPHVRTVAGSIRPTLPRRHCAISVSGAGWGSGERPAFAAQIRLANPGETMRSARSRWVGRFSGEVAPGSARAAAWTSWTASS
jgi:hypothetical protein